MSLCPLAKKCSGCQLQNLTYEEQLRMKQVKLIRLLGRYGHVEEIVGMEDPAHYRNKLQALFGFKNGRVVSGIYQSATGKLVETDDCLLEDRASARIVKTVRELCAPFKIKAFDLRTGRGFLRHVLVRRAFVSGEILVTLVTAPGDFPSCSAFVKELIRRHPEITTVVWNVNPTDTPLFLGRESRVLYGEGTITEELLGLRFRLSPRSFYQVNPIQTEVLYRTAREYAGLTGRERVIDAYCGTGTIGLTMAADAAELIGVEVNADAVEDARFNARANGVKNARFYAADAGEFMEQMARDGQKADVVITDPPRAGCSPRFLRSLIKLAPKRIVYVSCDPETLARDLNTLTRAGYKATKIQPVDMFPHTNHVESIVCLSREKADDYIRISVQTKDLKTKAN